MHASVFVDGQIFYSRQVKSSQVKSSQVKSVKVRKSSIFVLRVIIMCDVELQTPLLLVSGRNQSPVKSSQSQDQIRPVVQRWRHQYNAELIIW